MTFLFTLVDAELCFIGQSMKDGKAIFFANTDSVCECTDIYPGGVTAYKSLQKPFTLLPMLKVSDLFNPNIKEVKSKMGCPGEEGKSYI